MQIHRNTNTNSAIFSSSRRNLIAAVSLALVLVASLLATALHQNLFSSSLTAHASDTPTIVDPIYVGMLSSAVGELTQSDESEAELASTGDSIASRLLTASVLLAGGAGLLFTRRFVARR